MMPDAAFWLLAVLAAIASAALTAPLRLWLLRRGQVDQPGRRRSHARPTPRGGGLAIVAALVIAWVTWPGALAAWWQPMAAIVFMAAVGWIEDRHQLAAPWRFCLQLTGAVALVGLTGGIGQAAIPHIHQLAHRFFRVAVQHPLQPGRPQQVFLVAAYATYAVNDAILWHSNYLSLSE